MSLPKSIPQKCPCKNIIHFGFFCIGLQPYILGGVGTKYLHTNLRLKTWWLLSLHYFTKAECSCSNWGRCYVSHFDLCLFKVNVGRHYADVSCAAGRFSIIKNVTLWNTNSLSRMKWLKDQLYQEHYLYSHEMLHIYCFPHLQVNIMVL